MHPEMKSLLLLIYLLILSARLLLRWLNLRHLRQHGGEIPPGFAEAIDGARLRKSADYTLALARVGLIESLTGNLLLLLFLFGGWLTIYDRWVLSLSDSFILSGMLFFAGIFLAQTVLDIPFSLYRTFRIENVFGFNRMTFGLWWSDLLKGAAVSLLLLAGMVAGALALVQGSPQLWWLWVWLFFALLTLFLMYLSPYVIEPLFHRFEPLRREDLEEDIRQLTAKAGLKVSRVQQVDASRRSGHSNAYFSGIGPVKRIVLFDTLLEQMDNREILAVLAHEAGHWRRGHIVKRLFGMQLLSLAALYLSHQLLNRGGLGGLLGVADISFFAEVVILSFLGSLAGFFLTPLSAWWSRRHEWQADRFATELTGDAQALASALVKLARENLANLHPHPLYARFYYAHPPMVERVRALREARTGAEKIPVV
jgi:STE24 endopeptidase